jgi:3,4-dihydroxy 2-butanone 4-phosphate synthase/GTP cyclohydrolase II
VSEQDRSHVLEALRQRANRHFASTGHPFVTLSYAQSLDGSIAGVRGRPLAISGPESLMHTHALQALESDSGGINELLSKFEAEHPQLSVSIGRVADALAAMGF